MKMQLQEAHVGAKRKYLTEETKLCNKHVVIHKKNAITIFSYSSYCSLLEFTDSAVFKFQINCVIQKHQITGLDSWICGINMFSKILSSFCLKWFLFSVFLV